MSDAIKQARALLEQRKLEIETEQERVRAALKAITTTRQARRAKRSTGQKPG